MLQDGADVDEHIPATDQVVPDERRVLDNIMPGKYDLFNETIAMLNSGGLYIIDDMLPQSNWPLGHDEKVRSFISDLESRDNLFMTKMNWSTGIIIISKK